MRIADFALERYFARWEFGVRHVLFRVGFGRTDLPEALLRFEAYLDRVG